MDSSAYEVVFARMVSDDHPVHPLPDHFPAPTLPSLPDNSWRNVLLIREGLDSNHATAECLKQFVLSGIGLMVFLAASCMMGSALLQGRKPPSSSP